MLIIWSSTGTDYKEELENALGDKLYRPEFVLCLSKADYFEIKDSEVYSVIGDIEKILDEADVENIDSIMEKSQRELLQMKMRMKKYLFHRV